MEPQQRKPHSAEYFGETRDFWWNADFLQLMAARWDLSRVARVLDVGSGIGHWGRLMARLVPSSATITGVDREPAWVARAQEIAVERRLGERLSYRQGTAEALPFEDASFDLVTCQTVLIHVPDPRRVLAEMWRVVKPGGLLIVAEPNNLANALVFDSVSAADEPEALMTRLRFQLTCERGKTALGEGDNSIGGMLPAHMTDLGIGPLQVYISDRAAALRPPYDSLAEQAETREMLINAERDFWGWDRHDARRFFLAGGGTEAAFEVSWEIGRDYARRCAEAIRRGTYTTAGGQVFYLVSARKPEKEQDES